MSHGNAVEFAENGEFNLADYPDRTNFVVNGAASNMPSSNIVSTPSLNSPTTGIISHRSSASSSRRTLAVVKVVRADVGPNRKPTNVHMHNLSVHVNIYKEEHATVPYILHKVHVEMESEGLILVGPNGLIYYDQEGTRGAKFLLKLYLLV